MEQFSSFIVITAIKRSYRRNFILETNAKITLKETCTKFYESFICSTHTFFYKKCISIGTHPLGNKIAKSSVLNLHNHITVKEIAPSDR